MIRRLRVQNYRSLEDVTVDLEPLTVFIGPVGAGKSNVQKAIRLLGRVASGYRADELFGAFPHDFLSERCRASASAVAPISLSVEVSPVMDRDGCPPGSLGDAAAYEVSLQADDSGSVRIDYEWVARVKAGVAERVFDRVGPGGLAGDGLGGVDDADGHWSLLPGVQRAVGHLAEEDLEDREFVAESIRLPLVDQSSYHLDAEALRQPCRARPYFGTRLGYRGEDLPAVLGGLREPAEANGAFGQVVEALRSVLPEVDELRLTPAGTDRTAIAVQCRGQAGLLSANDLSDGTLYTLGLLAVALQPSPPRLLMLEEPETGLHPGRLRWLADQFWDLAHPDDGRVPTQVLISTHSPYLLDQFVETPEVVRVVESENGRTRITPLQEILGRLEIGPEKLRDDALGRRWYAGLFEGR